VVEGVVVKSSRLLSHLLMSFMYKWSPNNELYTAPGNWNWQSRPVRLTAANIVRNLQRIRQVACSITIRVHSSDREHGCHARVSKNDTRVHRPCSQAVFDTLVKVVTIEFSSCVSRIYRRPALL